MRETMDMQRPALVRAMALMLAAVGALALAACSSQAELRKTQLAT